MKEKIIEIIGFGMERELAELKADEIIKLFEGVMELNAIECLDCGYICKEKDLINKTGKHSKDEIVCCPKCESKDLKYY